MGAPLNGMASRRPDAPDPPDAIAQARRVLAVEIGGLQALERGIDASFAAALEAIETMKTRKERNGRVIVAGIGKSGHVARKIAATLASTGTPAFFVHPGEASHGDLGMITDADIVLMLSYSGGSAELNDLIHYTRRFGITLIAMTSVARENGETPLSQHADIVLRLPDMPEACPNGLAPTTSNTMMLALGDALAVALLERTGLTAEEFRVFHPGGRLGQKLLKVSDLMLAGARLPTVELSAGVADVLRVMGENNIGLVAVLAANGHTLAGIITEGDLRRALKPDFMAQPIDGMMTRNPMTIGPDALAAQALHVMSRTPGRYISALIVVGADEAVLGLLRLQDCLQAGVV